MKGGGVAWPGGDAETRELLDPKRSHQVFDIERCVYPIKGLTKESTLRRESRKPQPKA